MQVKKGNYVTKVNLLMTVREENNSSNTSMRFISFVCEKNRINFFIHTLEIQYALQSSLQRFGISLRILSIHFVFNKSEVG